ncbi:two-component system sensor histidine kinase CreC [Acinetobacter junii]|uniref:two-component system sensor histidine kinase CreC n=1 Tax=Acinetobacter junii TaxID=40215 RepID=UPI001957ACEE|nr:two-component system sensor histidine kinase CreC [Acinetobacter junii]MDI9721289.1 two-component system sensor histidine kinase CreC [Acinetobacter junii]VTX92100.1 Sensor protein CreC [Acinetobacter junii]
MSIFIRIWFFFSLVVMLSLSFIAYTLNQQVKPNVRQVVEDTLAENANIIAQLIAEDVAQQKVSTPEFDQKIQTALSRQLNATIWQHQKDEINQQLYITDQHGIVIYDSEDQAVGQDYSKWNDVYLTLRGKYGARSTATNPYDRNSSVMHIAAPIIYKQQLLGVVSIGKPNQSVQPYITRAERQLIHQALWIAALSLLLASMVAYWLRHSIDKVRRYAQALAPVNQAPFFYSAKELNQVTQALSKMREKLEDRAYVENYVNTLTHELKSPLTAIQASAELLQDDLPLADQQQFAAHIVEQSHRLQSLIERMLLLTRLEKNQHALEFQNIDLSKLIRDCLIQQQSALQIKQIQVELNIPEYCAIYADPFWLKQAINNLLDNARDFCSEQGLLAIQLRANTITITGGIEILLFNEGEAIPEYALNRVFETYFSLPRPHNQQRSTGIGLSIVQQIIQQHQGHVSIQNIPENDLDFLEQHKSGVLVKIILHRNFT